MSLDYALTPSDGGFQLAPPTSDPAIKLEARVITQLLSEVDHDRGSFLGTDSVRGLLRTSADFVTTSALSLARVRDLLKQYALDGYPLNMSLTNFTSSGTELRCDLAITMTSGQIFEVQVVL